MNTSARLANAPLASADLRSAARAAAQGAACADRERRLGHATVAVLSRAGFPDWFVPGRWGGREGAFAPLVGALAALGEECTSAAWCAGLWAAHGRLAAFLPERGQQELWGESPQVRISTGLAAHAGRAERTGTGWSLSGRWQYVSAIDSAQWVLLAAAAAPGRPDDGPVRVFAVPRAAVDVVDSWDAPGMRGTGSHTVLVHRTAVPDHRSFAFAHAMTGTHQAGAPAAARCHRAPARLVGGMMFCAPGVGAARALFRASIAGSAPQSGTEQQALTRAAAEIDTAELLLVEAARRADCQPVPATDSSVARNHRDASLAAELLVTAVNRLADTGRLRTGPGSGPLHRRRQDVLTLSSHAVLRFPDAAALYATTVLTA